jgi:large subunit ribosomal protein L4
MLEKNIFGLEVKNHGLLRYAYQSFLDNGRQNLAKTKTRGEVVGSTKKPWRQKGTGRARFGSRYNPIWRGGGITFGPTGNENYTKKINVKSKRLAVRQALSLATSEGKVKVIDNFDNKEGKVKKTAVLLKKIEANGKVLIVVDKKTDMITRATDNIADVNAVSAKYLNVFHILNADTVLISKKSLEILSDWLAVKTKAPAKKTEAKS